MKPFPLIIGFALFFFLLPLNVNALEVKPLKSEAVLTPCQSTIFPFELNANGPVSLSLTGLPSFLNHSLVPSMNVNRRAVVNVNVLYPCDAAPQTGTYVFSLIATQGSEAKAATSYLEVASLDSLSVKLLNSGLACACSSTTFTLELKNNGYKRESGTILVSTRFPFSISDTVFDLFPGQSVSKRIVLDLNCSVAPGIHSFSVGIASIGSSVKYYHSGVNVAQCFASTLTGQRNVTACHGEVVDVPFVVSNDGLIEQNYVISTTLGELSSSSAVIFPHSNFGFNVSLSPSLLQYPGTYNFTVSTYWENGAQFIPVQVNTHLCAGKPVPQLFLNFPVLDFNRSINVTPGKNAFLIQVHNPYLFTLHNAVFSVPWLGPVSDSFQLAPNESKNVSMLLNVPANFSSVDTQLVLNSDEGQAAKDIRLNVSPAGLTGFFLLGTFVGGELLIALALLLVLVAIALYFVHSENRKRYIVDKEVSVYLENILAKHRRS